MAREQIIHNIAYSIFAIVIGVFYFPLRLFFKKTFEGNMKEIIIEVLLSFLFLSIITLSILMLFGDDILFFRRIFLGYAIANNILLVTFIIRSNHYLFIQHFCFNLLISAVLFL